ncbi:hypothetical protein SAMD00019534_052890 [Acytostelium subglobosum LB1]|uniref:hypothetical protein n=1 Tax=Acytostelium subglobosum LB1 TaxID=1410327 RepID=UPI0006448AD3|nr:hypothetical protein SAMD00019534_052890 [Acytostelium subglobosum LB1]GAM22114.1 hypothetical protein SAMD00019534_052890 [Acytostelium subglobosum LB1]|eukprot:XP_012755214.1 hypothetical protein SAMD00019534_052890 [Acytostelium subglobosum LB1]
MSYSNGSSNRVTTGSSPQITSPAAQTMVSSMSHLELNDAASDRFDSITATPSHGGTSSVLSPQSVMLSPPTDGASPTIGSMLRYSSALSHSSISGLILSDNDDDDNNSELGDLEITIGEDLTSCDIEPDLLENLEEMLSHYAPTETVIAKAFKKGIDITGYSDEVRRTLDLYDEQMRTLYKDAVPDYVNERESFTQMYTTLKESNALLTGFEDMLLGFQNELTSISTEMRELQEKSINKSQRCTNRKKVVEKLNKLIDELSISDDVIHLLSVGEVNDQYMQYLSIFSTKIGHIQSQKMNEVAATTDVEASLLKLIQTVVEKVYRFFINQFNSIKTFATLQSKQQEFTLYRQAFIFLYRHTKKFARQLLEQYKDTVEKIYTGYFKNYVTFLEKLQFDQTSKNDLLGTPDNKGKGFFSSMSSKVKIKSSIFTVDTRYQILNEIEEAPIKPQSLSSSSSTTTQANQMKYSYEIIFRSMLFFIRDLVTFENMFINDLFLSTVDCSTQIFSKCESYYMDNLNSFISNTYDPIALMLIICITHKLQSKSVAKCESSERIMNQSTSMALARLRTVMMENIESIRNAVIRDLGPIEENRPHYVIRRYAELIGSFTMLFNHIPTDIHCTIREFLDMLRAVISNLLIKLSGEFKEKTSKSIFLINNYDLILAILSEKENPIVDDKDYFTLMYNQESEVFATEQLMSYPYIRRMIVFVKELLPLINMYTVVEINHPDLNKETQEAILKDFYSNWRTGIEEMNVIVTQLFPNFKNGTKIFQIILDRLFNSYKSFGHIVIKSFKQLKSSQYFIPETEMSYEIKKYYVSFD